MNFWFCIVVIKMLLHRYLVCHVAVTRFQGCRKLFRAGGGESRVRGILGAGGESQAAGQIAGSGGRIMQKKAFCHFQLLLFFGDITTIKT